METALSHLTGRSKQTALTIIKSTVVYVYLNECVCMHPYTYVCMYVCMHVRIYYQLNITAIDWSVFPQGVGTPLLFVNTWSALASWPALSRRGCWPPCSARRPATRRTSARPTLCNAGPIRPPNLTEEEDNKSYSVQVLPCL